MATDVTQAFEDPRIEDVVQQWVSLADSIVTFHVHVRGADIRPSANLRAAGIPIENSLQEVALDFDIEYTIARDRGERYLRNGAMPSPKGMKTFHQLRVLTGDHASSLEQGDSNAHYEYDQFKLELPTPIREPILAPIRNLLNISGNGKKKFFEDRTFMLAVGNRSEIGGEDCCVTESTEIGGTRIWFGCAKPYRIRKIELEFLNAHRSGHLEYLYEYTKNAQPIQEQAPNQDSAAELPIGWQATVFDASSKVRAVMDCRVLGLEVNREVPNSEFELIAPHGAIICDDRKRPSEYFLQLKDSVRPLQSHELSHANLFRLSASVPSSRIENQRTPSAEALRSKNANWRLTILVVVNIVVLVVLGVYYFVSRRDSRRV